MDADMLSKAVGSTVSDKRKSVTYAPSVNHSPELASGDASNGFSRTAGAKSMPASRRTSASEHDEELAGHLQGLSLAGDGSNRVSPVPGNPPHLMLDEQLDQEMHSMYMSGVLCLSSHIGFSRCYEESPHIGRRQLPRNLRKQGMICGCELAVTNTQTYGRSLLRPLR
jgi:hypothetical protein